MAIITISRQMGSLGSEVAHQAADRLGYRVVWRELINQAAKRAGAPEIALAVIDELGILGMMPKANEVAAYVAALTQAMIELSQEGNIVIIGRGGQVILHDAPGVLHIRVVAPVDVRVERIAKENGISLDAARARIKASDKSRNIFLRTYFNQQVDDPELYDMIINTGRMTTGQAVDMIVAAVCR